MDLSFNGILILFKIEILALFTALLDIYNFNCLCVGEDFAGNKGITQWKINWCIPNHYKHYWWKNTVKILVRSTHQDKIKVLKPTNKNCLFTSIIYNQMSPPFLRFDKDNNVHENISSSNEFQFFNCRTRKKSFLNYN